MRALQSGFTLVELVMVIIISAILAVGTTRFIAQSSQSLVTSSERLTLSTTAGLISERISREVRSALPNSVRTFEDGGFSCLEFVPVINSSEYLSIPVAAAANSFQAVQFADGDFDSGYLSVYPSSTTEVYNTTTQTVTQAQVATAASVATGVMDVSFPAGVTVQLPAESPTRRFYLVSQPVSFCEDTNGRVWRYFNYGFHADSRASLPAPAANRVVIGDGVQPGSLDFQLTPAQLQRNAMIRVSLTTQSGRGEQVSMAQEVQLRNVP